MEPSTIVFFVFGLILLVSGAEALVRGATRFASMIGMPPLVIGLTVVAFGTSLPEMAVSVHSSLIGRADIALGDVVGSNIFNVLFILGLSALVTPLKVSFKLVRLDVPIMIGVSVLTLLFALGGKISRWEGVLLFMGIFIYTTFLVYQSRRENRTLQDEFSKEYRYPKTKSIRQWTGNTALILCGFGMLVLGSRWLVEGAMAMARALGISELVIGLTVVAAGTSLPELATSVIASIRKEADIAVGNVVGSNIFNILGVLGLSSAVSSGGIPVSSTAFGFDIPIMIAVAVACLPIFFTGGIISRWEGLLFLGYYLAYILYMILASTGHAVLTTFSTVMILFVIPITIITLMTIALRAIRRK